MIKFLERVFGSYCHSISFQKKSPNQIIGKKLLIRNLECAPNGLTNVKFPPATFLSVEHEQYKIVLDHEVVLNEKQVKYATISARHRGYPVSNISKRGVLAVTGRFDTGEDFIACINLL